MAIGELSAGLTLLASLLSALQIDTVATVVPLANVYPLFIIAISYALIRRLPTSPHIVAGFTSIVVGATLMQVA